MSKLSETNALIEAVERITEPGASYINKVLLCDIAKSLAMIADSLSKNEEKAEGKIYDIEYSRWIPTSERFPEEDGEYLATIYDMDEDHEYMDIAEFEDGKWQYKNFIKVLAWMPLSKQYKER